MAKFSQQFLRAMTQPAYQEGLFTAARQLGEMPGRMRQQADIERKKQNLAGMLKGATPGTAEYTSILADYYSEVEKDPEKANTLGALARQQAEAQASQISGERALTNLKAAARAKASKSPKSEQLLPLINSMGISQLQDYLKPTTPAEYTLSPGQARMRGSEQIASLGPKIEYVTDDILNTKTGNIESVRFGFQDGKEVSKQVLGIVPSRDGSGGIGGAGGPGSKERLLNLEALAEERGITVDYDSAESLEALQRLAGSVLDDASLANSFNSLIDRVRAKTPGLTESLTVMRSINPNMASAEADLDTARKFLSLDRLTADNVAGLVPLIERVVTSAYPNDIKAQQELNRFRGSKDIIRRISDAVTMAVSGTLTDDTFREYRQIMAGVQELASKQIVNEAINTYSISDSDREKNAALNVIKMYGGKVPARIVP